MASCLTAASHYLSQCWLHIREVLWHSPKAVLQRVPKLLFCIVNLKILVNTATSPMGQRVNLIRLGAGCEAGWGSKFFTLEKKQSWKFFLLYKITQTTSHHFVIPIFLEQYLVCQITTIQCANLQYLTLLSEKSLFSNFHSNVPPLLIVWSNKIFRSQPELYIIERNKGV